MTNYFHEIKGTFLSENSANISFEPKKDSTRFEEYFKRFEGNQTKLFNYLTDGKYASGPPKTPKQRRQFNKKQKLHQGSLGTILEDENAKTDFIQDEESEDEDCDICAFDLISAAMESVPSIIELPEQKTLKRKPVRPSRSVFGFNNSW